MRWREKEIWSCLICFPYSLDATTTQPPTIHLPTKTDGTMKAQPPKKETNNNSNHYCNDAILMGIIVLLVVLPLPGP